MRAVICPQVEAATSGRGGRNIVHESSSGCATCVLALTSIGAWRSPLTGGSLQCTHPRLRPGDFFFWKQAASQSSLIAYGVHGADEGALPVAIQRRLSFSRPHPLQTSFGALQRPYGGRTALLCAGAAFLLLLLPKGVLLVT